MVVVEHQREGPEEQIHNAQQDGRVQAEQETHRFEEEELEGRDAGVEERA